MAGFLIVVETQTRGSTSVGGTKSRGRQECAKQMAENREKRALCRGSFG